MKKIASMVLISIAALVFLSLFFGQIPRVYADATTSGGRQVGAHLRTTKTVHQRAFYPHAKDIHTGIYTKKGLKINGWKVTFSLFTNARSQADGTRRVNMDADGTDIPFCTDVTITYDVWLSRGGRVCPNYQGSWVRWTWGSNSIKALPNHHWGWNWPKPDPQNPGKHLHPFHITNDDATDYLNITGLAFNATMDWYEDLTQICFPSPYPNITLAPGESWSVNVSTSGSLDGGHIYFNYKITGSGFISEDWVDHPSIKEETYEGGVWVPVDKFGLLVPYVGVASTILIATVAVAIYARRVKHKKEKQ
jgi:type II secretory pathway pseudopilin PulG